MTIDEILERTDRQIASARAQIVRSMIAMGLEDNWPPLALYALTGEHEAAEACWSEIKRRRGVRWSK